ncbi:hypothetical protein JHD49_06150 [Sulfurimonas sp. SAG-AH-194-C21]|nr:hypothetical protein [Sulfurimonas sp. SAG-AH-194-C21]MDF1883518.1 hypothetical protein [Sulfurimonas sp. SAG-AH-194-C21]
MYTIEIEKECACFLKSDIKNNMEFETREDMINKARVIECLMNQNFCMTHYFQAVDYQDKIVIHSTVRPTDEDDDDVETSSELVRRSGVVIGFDAGEKPPKDAGGN